jgi:hypothetical protein
MDLVDGNERFGARIEEMQGNKNKALGYDPHLALEEEYN